MDIYKLVPQCVEGGEICFADRNCDEKSRRSLSSEGKFAISLNLN